MCAIMSFYLSLNSSLTGTLCWWMCETERETERERKRETERESTYRLDTSEVSSSSSYTSLSILNIFWTMSFTVISQIVSGPFVYLNYKEKQAFIFFYKYILSYFSKNHPCFRLCFHFNAHLLCVYLMINSAICTFLHIFEQKYCSH